MPATSHLQFLTDRNGFFGTTDDMVGSNRSASPIMTVWIWDLSSSTMHKSPHLPESEDTAARSIDAAAALRKALRKLRFSSPVAHVYNPLEYAWGCYESYLRRYASGP